MSSIIEQHYPAFTHDELVQHLSGLRSRAIRLCRNCQDADDLVHETIVRALEFERTFVAGTNLRAWLHQILFSVFVSRCRRTQRERRALDALRSDPCGWTKQDAAPAMRALGPKLRGAIDALPRQFALAVQLVDLDDLSYKEAAAELRVPIGTVMSRLFRGRRMLANALSPAEAA